MKVFKFGGASVKNADSVKNVGDIILAHSQDNLVIVISAMGKMTNHLEAIIETKDPKEQTQYIEEFSKFHLSIANDLGIESDFFPLIQVRLDALRNALQSLEDPHALYDEIVSQGELTSTCLINCYLKSINLNSTWLDVRTIIKTSDAHKVTNVNWESSEKNIPLLRECTQTHDVTITQGFIASNSKGATTTLGREGSDFSAAILAYLLDAENVTIWKDVPGMLNADPRWFEETVKLEEISYREAIELAYYGASVIHPKTVKPLQNKNIPLFVKSFLDFTEPGTVIREGVTTKPLVPSYIFKKDQLLVSFSSKDFSFVEETHLSDIFSVLADHKSTVNLMQNSAVSFSIVVDASKISIRHLQNSLEGQFSIKFNDGLELLTIRHYDEEIVGKLTKNKRILVEQRSRSTLRLVLSD